MYRYPHSTRYELGGTSRFADYTISLGRQKLAMDHPSRLMQLPHVLFEIIARSLQDPDEELGKYIAHTAQHMTFT